MLNRSAIRLYGFLAVAFALMASPARAQFTPVSLNDPPPGERYHIEGGIGVWNPNADMSVSISGGGALAGISGTTIDFKKDLGLTDQSFKELHLVLRPAKKHKFRLQYIPVTYTQSARVTRDIKFNGQLYHVGIDVESALTWKTTRLGYEYDIASQKTWYAGVLLDLKFTDFLAELDSPTRANPSIHEFAHAQAPVPGIGGVVRYYPIPNASVTFELNGIKIPTIADKYEGHYADLDVYGRYDINRYVGAQLGYRSVDVGGIVKDDFGSFTLKGIYFGVVARY